MTLTAVGDLSSAISTVGFPIVMCLALFYYIWKCDGANRTQIEKLSDANRTQIEKLSDALNNNTSVITKLLERMDSN